MVRGSERGQINEECNLFPIWALYYKLVKMKSTRFLFLGLVLAFILSSCSVFKPKYGCPSDGKNIGAEKLLDGSSAKKAKKFRA
jgi:hypothetical protein